MRNSVLTSTSPDVQKRSFSFVNVSKSPVPPFGVMQIVNHPNVWQEEIKSQPTAFLRGKLKTMGIMPQDLFSNEVLFYCDKPSIYSEAQQDHTKMAINSDTEVAPNSIGRCFYNEYPARALCRASAIQEQSYMIVQDQWYLDGTNPQSGAFACIRNGVGPSIPGATKDASYSSTSLVTANPFCRRADPSVKWSYDGAGQGKFPMYITERGYGNIKQPGSEGIIYENGGNIVLGENGFYSITGCFDYMIHGNPGQLSQINHEIKIDGVEARVDSPKISRNTPFSFTMYRHHLPNPPPQVGVERWVRWIPPAASLKRVWARVRVIFNQVIAIELSPVRICINHTVGQYLKTKRPLQSDELFLNTSPVGSGSIIQIREPSLWYNPRYFFLKDQNAFQRFYNAQNYFDDFGIWAIADFPFNTDYDYANWISQEDTFNL